jgi:hypothetical protein
VAAAVRTDRPPEATHTLLERDAELALLDGALEAAQRGRGVLA